MTIKTTIKEKMNYQEARNELGKQKKNKNLQERNGQN